MSDLTPTMPPSPGAETFRPASGVVTTAANANTELPIGHSEREALTTPQVVGLSVGAAALVGGLYLAVEPPPAPTLPPAIERAIKKLPRSNRRQARAAAAAAGAAVTDIQHHAVATAGTLADRLGAARDRLQQQVAEAVTAAGSQLIGSGERLAPSPAARARVRWPFRRKPATTTERGRKRMSRAMRKANKRAAKTTDRALSGISSVVDDAGDKMSDIAKALSTVGRHEEPTMSERLHATVDAAGHRTGKLTKRGRRRIERQLRVLEKQRRVVAKRARSGAKQLREQGQAVARVIPGREKPSPQTQLRSAGQRLGQALSTTVANIAPALASAREADTASRLRGGASSTLTTATRRVTELGQHIREDLVPQALEATQQARARAAGLVPADLVAARAGDVLSRAGEQVGQLAAQASEVASKASQARHEAAEEARRAAQRSRRALDATGSAVRAAGGQALSATGGAVKELALSATWLGALGAVVYFGFLNDDQRDKVATTARSLYEQAREVIRDFQGYDEEF